jgi:hypothetical protein
VPSSDGLLLDTNVIGSNVRKFEKFILDLKFEAIRIMSCGKLFCSVREERLDLAGKARLKPLTGDPNAIGKSPFSSK